MNHRKSITNFKQLIIRKIFDLVKDKNRDKINYHPSSLVIFTRRIIDIYLGHSTPKLSI